MFRNIEKLDEMKIQGKKGVRKLRISIKKRMDDGKTIQMEKEFRKRTRKIFGFALSHANR